MASRQWPSSDETFASGRGDVIEELRHPGERPALLACVFTNITIVVMAAMVIFAGTEWLETRPLVHKYVTTFRALAIAAIVAFPATAVWRHVHLYEAKANGIRVSQRQFPELHAALLHACQKLGVTHVPELYIGRIHATHGGDEIMAVHSIYGAPHCIVIDSDWLVDKVRTTGLDFKAFVIARGVAMIRLGHTRWWVEMLTLYVKHIPGLRRPLLMSATYSRDRCAAYAVPEGVRGLLIEATGKDMIWTLDLEEVLAQPLPTGAWPWLVALHRERPHLLERIHALYEAGLFDLRRDLEVESERRHPHALTASSE